MSKVSKEAQNMYKHVFAHNFLNIHWLCMSKVSKEAQNMYKHVFAHNFLNIQWIFNLEKVLES